MKITIGELRAVIRECLDEQADVPGRWRASNGEPVEPEDVDLMSTGGTGRAVDEEHDDVREGLFGPGPRPKFVASTTEEMSRKFPEFFAYARAKLGPDLARAQFAIDKSGLLGRGTPYVAPADPNLPVIYYNPRSKEFDFNSSVTLARTIRNLPA